MGLAPLEMQELSEQLRELQDKVVDALSRKERVKSRRVRGMILAAQSKVFKQENVLAERLHGLECVLYGSDLGSIGRKCNGRGPCIKVLDASLHVPLDEIKVDKTLRFVEERVENSDREVKRLKCSRIVVVKICASVCGSCKAIRHGLYETIVCYVLLANVIWIVVLELDRLKALVDLSVTVSLLWIVDSERDRLIVNSLYRRYCVVMISMMLRLAFPPWRGVTDPVMSSSSTVTYTSVYTDSEPGRVFWGADEELSDGSSPRVIVYGYDGLPMQPVAVPSPDYVPGPEHPPSPDYVPGPEHPPSLVEVPYVPEPKYPKYLVPADAEAPLEDQPLPADASPIALSPGYVVDFDPGEDLEEDPEEDHADYPADGGDDDDEPSDDDNDDTDDEDEESFEDEEEEEHLAPADPYVIPVLDPVPSARDTEAFETDESAPTPRSPQTKVSFAQTRLRRAQKTVRLEPPMSPSIEARIVEYVAAPKPQSPPTSLLSPWSSPLPQIPSPPLPPLPSSLHLPPPVLIPLPLPSSPLPPLPVLLFIPLPFDRREDIPEAELPPHKRLCLTAPTSRYEVGESLTATPRPIGGHRADYGFIRTTDAEIRRRRAEEVGYGIRDVWVDPTEAVEEVAPTTLEGVNTRVTELAAVQEEDTQDVYAVIEDTQDRQTQLFQRVDGLVEDRQFHYKTARLLDREALVSRKAWAHSVRLSSVVHYELQAYRTHTQMQDYRIASQESLMTTLITHVSSLQGQLSATLGQIQALQARDQTHADDPEGAEQYAAKKILCYCKGCCCGCYPITAAVEQLIKARVSAALANHDTLRNITNGHGDGSHNSETGIRGTVRTPRECTYKDFMNCKPLTFKGTEGVVALSQWFEKMESVFHISNCFMENQKALKKMMTVKYYPIGEIKKLEIELWNLKVKGTDVASYTLLFQELALMCGRMFHEELKEVEKYVGGLPNMIRGNVISYQPKTIEKSIEFANDQMDQKVLIIIERQAEQKWKLEFNARNNQGHQQQNKRQNTRRAYTAGPGEKREYT
ncbi:hypothetical protein Tco_0929711 [Tanacetum coccineum]